MKKTIAMLMIAVLALSLVACGGGAAASVAAPAPAPSAPAAAAKEPSDASQSTAEDVGGAAAVGEDWGLTEAYMGVSSSDEAIFIGFNPDWTLAVFVAVSEDGQYVSFVGPAVSKDDGTVTIADDANKVELSFGVTKMENGNLALDMGDLGTAEVAACEVQQVMDAILAIDEAGQAVA